MKLLADGWLKAPWKGGKNDLRRWKDFGGILERTGPPAPINRNLSEENKRNLGHDESAQS